jgi:hypothetical protein
MAGIVQHRRARDCMNNDPRRANSHNDHDTIGVVDCLVGDGKSPS